MNRRRSHYVAYLAHDIVIDKDGAEDIPAEVASAVLHGQRFRPLETDGGGACGLHAIFGTLTHGVIKHIADPAALRGNAAGIMRVALTTPTSIPQHLIESVWVSIWNDLAVAGVPREQDAEVPSESKCFWSHTAPAEQERLMIAIAQQESVRDAECVLKDRLTLIAREACSTWSTRLVVATAIRLGYLPSGTDASMSLDTLLLHFRD